MSRSGSEDASLRLVREDIAQQTDGEKFFVNEHVFSLCWGKIHVWLNWDTLVHQMISCGLTTDPIELRYMTKNDGMRLPENEIALFKLLKRNAEIGFHLMYICIKRDKEGNYLGHKSAKEALEECAQENRSRPPSRVMREDVDDAPRIQLSQEESERRSRQEGRLVHAQIEGTSQRQPSSPVEPTAYQAALCTEESGGTPRGPVPVAAIPAVPPATLSTVESSATERYDTTAHSEKCSSDANDQMVSTTFTASKQEIDQVSPLSLAGDEPFSPAVAESSRRPDPPPPNEYILEIVRTMLRFRRCDVTFRSCDLQLKSTEECNPTNKFFQAVAMFLVHCLNSRAQGLSYGVLLAGVSCQLESSVVISDLGLNLSANLTEQQILDEAGKMVRAKSGASWVDVEPQVLTSVAQVKMLAINGENGAAAAHKVLAVIVKPGTGACRDLLFAYRPSPGKAVEVFIRTRGRPGQLHLQSDIDQLQQQLINNYVTHSQ